MKSRKILLLNMPFKGEKLQRDFSCAHSSKADYYWPPIDLVAYSGIFNDQEVYLIDSVMENLDSSKTIEKVRELSPDYIFTIISAISLKEDLSLLAVIKKEVPKIKICASGDLCSFEPKKMLKHEVFDFIISDFTEKKGIRQIISGKSKIRIICSSKKEFEIGIPMHELFKKYAYKMPYSFYSPVASVITNYGCPFRCKFCNSNNLKFKSRKIPETIKDLKYLETIGIKEVYMRDFTFGVPHLEALLKKMIDENIKIKWSCEFRADLANEKILKLMKDAGCFLIFYGGESGNQKTLDLMNKGFGLEQFKKAIDMTKKAKIETLASFIIGFDSENEQDIKKTQDFILKTNPDYISINVLVPRIGSTYRKESLSNEESFLDNSKELGKKYSSGKFALDYKKEIERKFFFRPIKLLRYLRLSAKTMFRFKNFVNNGVSIVSRL